MKINKLRYAILAAIAAPVAASSLSAQAAWEFNGYLKGEVAATTDNGEFIGARRAVNDTSVSHSSGDVYKSEVSARMFINGDIFESSSLHADINLMGDFDAEPNGYKSPKEYTQQDPLRELYIDTSVGDTYVRLGKQQVVWGTADGIKLLDIINPTDYREFVQNTMEDSRIPVWMGNVDIPVGDNGSFQVILSQHEENKIPGLHADGDAGHPFIMKGVDTITGPVNGFLNIAPALSKVANTFTRGAVGGAFDVDDNGAGDAIPVGLIGFGNLSVDGFASNASWGLNADGSIRAQGSAGVGAASGGFILNTLAQTPTALNPGLDATNANNNVTALTEENYSPLDGSANTAFEYMPNATFATFNSFSGSFTNNGIRSEYVRDYPDDNNPNFGARFKTGLDNGLNFSVNYFYHYDANPSVNLSWHDAATGEKLQTIRATHKNTALVGLHPDATTNVAAGDVPSTFTGTGSDVSILLRGSKGFYGTFDPDPTDTVGNTTDQAVLRFTETVHRMHSIGGSFDYSLDFGDTPVVLRGEFLYDKDAHVPVVDRRLLAVGDLENALRSEEADFFKYVIGVDVTVLTNLLVSGQFIQFRNLDYVEEGRTCTTQRGNQFNCSKYTANPATLHLSNGLQQAEENQDFVSLFFSKPFGEAQLGRFNNITIWEEGGGYWNRADVEYSFSDNLVGTAEWNKYWGDENTMFGQFEKSSNVQVGIKYIF